MLILAIVLLAIYCLDICVSVSNGINQIKTSLPMVLASGMIFTAIVLVVLKMFTPNLQLLNGVIISCYINVGIVVISTLVHMVSSRLVVREIVTEAEVPKYQAIMLIMVIAQTLAQAHVTSGIISLIIALLCIL